MNNLNPQLEPVALGDAPGTVELTFPEHETWLGSADPEVIAALEARGRTIKVPVKMALLDDYLPQLQGHQNILIKIDVEGLEERVLNGAQQTLATVRPLIIFECNERSRLKTLERIFSASNYAIARLPWSEGGTTVVSAADLATTRDTNFLAIPR